MKLLTPDVMVNSVFDIDFDVLGGRGIRCLIVDLDNTLAPWNQETVNESLRRWVEKLRQKGFEICIVSNNRTRRVSPFAAKLGVRFIADAGKPSRRSFISAAALLGVGRERCAVVGDQLFTDISGGKRAGMFTILVNPMEGDQHIGTRLLRIVESFFIKRRV